MGNKIGKKGQLGQTESLLPEPLWRIGKCGQLGNQIFVFPFYFFLVVIGVGIVGGMLLFFGGEYDFRSVDAGVLNFEIRKCLDSKDLNLDFSNKENFEKDLFEKCRLNREVLESKGFVIGIKKIVDKEGYEFGSPENCALNAKENKAFPVCDRKEIEINEDRYEVLTGSNQGILGRRAGV